MEFKFKLDGTDIPEPDGWQDMTYAIDRDMDINLIYGRPVGKLVFTNWAYFHIWDLFKVNGFCYQFTLEIEYKTKETNIPQYFHLVLNISECEFNTFQHICTVEIRDNSYIAQFKANKKIEAYVNTNITKNLLPITQIPQYELLVFNPANGVYYADIPFGFWLFDVFNTLVSFTSDNNITFRSDFLQTGRGKSFVCITGKSLRLYNNGGTDAFPGKVSFEVLYYSLMQKCNLGMSLGREAGILTLRIEPIDYFYTNTNKVTLPDIKDEIQFFLKERLFSSVQVGSEVFTEIGQCDSGNTPCTIPQFDLYMFANEQFGILGSCNIDRTADLCSRQEISYDTNTIEDCIRYSNENNDRTIFIIDADVDTGTTNSVANQTDFYNSGRYIYNDYFTNKSCLQRWMQNGLPGNITSYYAGFTAANQVWEVGVTVAELCYSNWLTPVQSWNLWINTGAILFDNVVTDPSTLYNPANGRVTIVMPGIYTINSLVRCIAADIQAPLCLDNANSYNFAMQLRYFLTIYDVDGTPLFEIPSPIFDNGTSFQAYDSSSTMAIPSATYLLDAGMYVECVLYAWQTAVGHNPANWPDAGGGNFVVYDTDTIFECTAAQSLFTGEVVSDAVDVKMIASKFTKHLNFPQLSELIDIPDSQIEYTTLPNEGTKAGYIYSSETNLATLKTDFQLLLQ